MTGNIPKSFPPDFPEDYELEDISVEDLLKQRDFELEEDSEDFVEDFWLPPEKSLRF